MASPKTSNYRFTFGPWNISTGRDPFGPEVRKEVSFAAKLREYKKLGFDGVQLHDGGMLTNGINYLYDGYWWQIYPA